MSQVNLSSPVVHFDMTTMQHLSYSCDDGSFFCGGLAVRSSGSAWCTHPSALQSWTGGCESFERLMSKTLLGAEVGLSSHRLRPQQANNQAFSPSFLTLVEDRDAGFTISARPIKVMNGTMANSISKNFLICLSVLPMLYCTRSLNGRGCGAKRAASH